MKWIIGAIWIGFVLVWFIRNVIFYFTRKPVALVTDFTRYRDPSGSVEFDVPANWIIRHKAPGVVQFRDPDREVGSLLILPSLLPSRILSFSLEQGAQDMTSFGKLSDFVKTQCNERGYHILSIERAMLDNGTEGCLVDYQAARHEKRLVLLLGGMECNLNLSTFPDEFDASVFDRALRTLKVGGHELVV
jgi:hypothetical protein